MPSTRFRRLVLVTHCVSVCAAGPVCSAGAAAADARITRARELFAAAERDEDAGRWEDALEKLAQVAEVKPTAGVRYHQALCEEHLGRLTRALEDYRASEDQARSESAQDVLQMVGKRLADVTARVPHVTLRLLRDSPGAEINLDGAPVTPDRVGVPMAVDPGDHVVEATTPNRPGTTKHVRIEERDNAVIDLDPGEPPPTPPVEQPAPRSLVEPAPPRSGAWPLGLSLGAVAAAGLGVGAFIEAGQAHDAAKVTCARALVCDAQKNTVRAWDWAAAGMWAAAAAGGVFAVVLWSRAAPSPARASLGLNVGAGSVDVRGAF